MDPHGVLENWRAESALFVLSRREAAKPAG
jgi:hypothetical protein